MKKFFLCSIIFILFFTGCTKQNDITDNITTGSSDIQSTDDVTSESDNMTAKQAFVEREYLTLLDEYSLQYGVTDFYLSEHHISLMGGIEVDYYWVDQLYNLYIVSDTTYVKDGQTKNAHLVVATACYPDREIIYNATLTISDGQTFFLGYSPMYNSILNQDEFSEEKGNAMSFVTPLHLWILSIFKEAETITTLQYPLLTAWYQQQTAVQENIKTWNQVISAYDIIDSPDSTLNLSFGTPEKRIITFFNKGYWNLLEKTSYSARLTGITMDLASLHTTGDIGIHYYFDDDMFNLIIEKEINYTKNDKPKSGSLYISYICHGDYTSYGGFFTLPDGQVFYLMYDPINNILLDNEKGSATFGQPTKFVSSLNAALIEEFKKAYMIATAQYPVLITWNNELNEVKQGLKDFNEIREADTIDVDTSLVKNDPYCTGTLVEQGELLTEMLLNSHQYSPDFNEINNENQNAEYYMSDLVAFKDNDKHPYAYLVNQDSDGYYLFYFSDLQRMNRELFGEEKELTHYTEGIHTNTSLGRYETGFEFGGGESRGPEYDVLWIRGAKTDDMVQVDFELEFYLYDNNEFTGKMQSRLGKSCYKIINEEGNTFLQHIYTDIGE